MVTPPWGRILKGDWRDSIAPSLALFGSASTLVCCALPALLISTRRRRDGRTHAALPGIMWLSSQKYLSFLERSMAASTLLWWQQRLRPALWTQSKPRLCTAAPNQRLAVVRRLERT